MLKSKFYLKFLPIFSLMCYKTLKWTFLCFDEICYVGDKTFSTKLPYENLMFLPPELILEETVRLIQTVMRRPSVPRLFIAFLQPCC